jgi:hypothetical protein
MTLEYPNLCTIGDLFIRSSVDPQRVRGALLEAKITPIGECEGTAIYHPDVQSWLYFKFLDELVMKERNKIRLRKLKGAMQRSSTVDITLVGEEGLGVELLKWPGDDASYAHAIREQEGTVGRDDYEVGAEKGETNE